MCQVSSASRSEILLNTGSTALLFLTGNNAVNAEQKPQICTQHSLIKKTKNTHILVEYNIKHMYKTLHEQSKYWHYKILTMQKFVLQNINNKKFALQYINNTNICIVKR